MKKFNALNINNALFKKKLSGTFGKNFGNFLHRIFNYLTINFPGLFTQATIFYNNNIHLYPNI